MFPISFSLSLMKSIFLKSIIQFPRNCSAIMENMTFFKIKSNSNLTFLFVFFSKHRLKYLPLLSDEGRGVASTDVFQGKSSAKN